MLIRHLIMANALLERICRKILIVFVLHGFAGEAFSLHSFFPTSHLASHSVIGASKSKRMTALLSSTTEQQQTTPSSTRNKNDVRSVSPYSIEEQWEALNSLVEGSGNPAFDARHIFGYGNPNHDLSMLQTLTATRLLDSRRSPNKLSIQELESQAQIFRKQHGPALNLQLAIQQQAVERNTIALAAEFKRASPSKGIMASDISITAAHQASIYAEAGATIISVLTEPRWFLGSFDDLTEARLATASEHGRPVILCKEFIVEEYLIAQAAAAGADTCLLIVAVTPQHLLARLIAYARKLGMEPLVEVHAMIELDVALACGAKVIGVNNRNLHTFQMDMGTSERIATEMRRRNLQLRTDYTLCALSGMSSADDVHRYRKAGLQMCLIGESLMRSPNPSLAIAGLCLNEEDYKKSVSTSNKDSMSVVGGAYTGGMKLIKVCGITSPDDAIVACQAGANLIGVIFAEKSKRKVTPQEAKAVVEAVRKFGERRERHAFELGARGEDPMRHLVRSSQDLVETATTRRPLVVGVFQNQDSEYIARMVEECGLDLVQLHGKEGFAAANPARCGGVPAIRVVDITIDPETGKAASTAVEEILGRITNDPIAILLDTAIKGKEGGGGTSTVFDWSIAQAVQNAGLPVLVAGGLTTDNVGTCVTSLRPFGIDVSSGVELTARAKNHDSVRAFVCMARQASVVANQGF